MAPVDTTIAPAANQTSMVQCLRKNFLQISRPLSDPVSITMNFLPFPPYRGTVLVTCSKHTGIGRVVSGWPGSKSRWDTTRCKSILNSDGVDGGNPRID